MADFRKWVLEKLPILGMTARDKKKVPPLSYRVDSLRSGIEGAPAAGSVEACNRGKNKFAR